MDEEKMSEQKPREFWVGWPDSENPEVVEIKDGDPQGAVLTVEKKYADQLERELAEQKTIVQAISENNLKLGEEIERLRKCLSGRVRFLENQKLRERIAYLREGLEDIEDNERYGMERECWQGVAKHILKKDDELANRQVIEKHRETFEKLADDELAGN